MKKTITVSYAGLNGYRKEYRVRLNTDNDKVIANDNRKRDRDRPMLVYAKVDHMKQVHVYMCEEPLYMDEEPEIIPVNAKEFFEEFDIDDHVRNPNDKINCWVWRRIAENAAYSKPLKKST